MTTTMEALERRSLLADNQVLFVRGADRSGGFLEATNDLDRTRQLADINDPSTANPNRNWFQFAQALRDDGFVVTQVAETLEANAPPTGQTQGRHLDLETLNLDTYRVVVMGSNNAVYDQAAIDALDRYVRRGGSVLFISDANFGSSWRDAPDSDQQFLNRFGLIMNQDEGTYTLTRAGGDFLVPEHPILAGVNTFDGEGVSPLVVPATSAALGVTRTILVRARNQTRNNNGNNPANNYLGTSRLAQASDGSLVVASADGGRVAGHFDRNTFFNSNGAGTSITRFDNRRYAMNLFNWLALGPADNVAPRVNDANFDNARLPLKLNIRFSESVARTLTASDLTIRNVATNQTIGITGVDYDTANNAASVRLAGVPPDGNYRLTLPAGSVADARGNTLASTFTFDFHQLAGDANGDRTVNFSDLIILATQYGQSNQTFQQGDFNYDQRVQFDDLVLLAARYNQSLASPRISPGPARVIDLTLINERDDELDERAGQRRRSVNEVLD